MHKLLTILSLVLILISCKDKVQLSDLAVDENYVLNSKAWPKKFEVNSTVKDILQEWPEYNAMDLRFDAIYKAANKDDLSLTIENIIEEQKLLEDSKYPVEFDKPQIKSRQKVFKTYVLKVKGDLIYRLDPQQSIVDMINAYNTHRKQFNIVLNSALDTKLILEEK